MAADLERNVLDFYQIPDLFPTEWPASKNELDVSEGGDKKGDSKKANYDRRKSRYQALERAVGNKSTFGLGSETSANLTSLIPRDEPDPLGTTDSVVRTLKQMGLPLQEDHQLRKRFLLSSTTFSPTLLLSQMHASADTQSLLNGLDYLSQSIDQKSASLKILVESNFERFVRAKATIDNVYKEMKHRGVDPAAEVRGHPRRASRNSIRNSMGLAAASQPASQFPHADSRKKNALVKESEYGVIGIKAPLLDVSAKAQEVWGPALGGREKEENLKIVAQCFDKHKEIVEASSQVADCIKRQDYETLVEGYNKVRRFARESRSLADNTANAQPGDAQFYQIILAARIWHDVDEQIHSFKLDTWKRLVSTYATAKADRTPGQAQDQHLELVSLLLELGVDDNPIWVWLLSRYDFLKNKIQATADRAKVDIEVSRRRLAAVDKPSAQLVATHLRALGRQSVERKAATYDSPDVIELWEMMVSSLSSILSSQGILGEVVEFWQIVRGFIDGKTQRTLPTGFNDESRVHHQLAPQRIEDLTKGVAELVDMIREHVLIFFAGPPPDDLSTLLSPLFLSPATPRSPNPNSSTTPTALRDLHMSFDANNIPPTPEKRGEAWEKYAFWPPGSNSISGVHYLSQMLVLVGSAAADMATFTPVGGQNDNAADVDKLKVLVTAARERCVTALCISWSSDAENIKYVEDWQRSSERREVTRMPSCFYSFESTLLAGMLKILYISEAMSKPGVGDIVLPPSPKLLQMVRSQYVTTLYKALSGMVENAERFIKKSGDGWTTDVEGSEATKAALVVGTAAIADDSVNPGDRSVRMLLTLSNLQFLRADVVPRLNAQFENAFAVKLTDETKTIRDVLGQIDARLFQSYTQSSINYLHRIIQAGLSDPGWAPAPGTKPTEVRPYIYEVLLNLVLVHAQVSTTAASLTGQVLSHLFEQLTHALLDALRARAAHYPLETLIQATLDVEFIAQTLSHYTTDRASALQTDIYQELDARTDAAARASLQTELPEMRKTLKRLREASKSEFACFRKARRRPTDLAKEGTVMSPVEET